MCTLSPLVVLLFLSQFLNPRKAAGKSDHNRVAMYLRKYREGRARRRELPSVAVYNTALRALDRCSKWGL